MIRSSFKFTTLVTIAIVLWVVSSCNPDEQIPSYIHIDKIDLVTDYSTQGSTSSKFTDAWVYVDDQPLGVYELPATFPILQDGSHKIDVRAGIKVNGIGATRAAYSMCDFGSQVIDLQKNVTVNLNPSVSYFPAIDFELIEDFENIGVSLASTSNSDTIIQITDTEVFEGNKSAAIHLDANHPFFECTSSIAYSLPKSADVFLELNYKCNNKFIVGVYPDGSSTGYATLVVNPSNGWNKIYINLINEVSSILSTSSFSVFISMQKSDGVDFPELYLDNIKLLHQ